MDANERYVMNSVEAVYGAGSTVRLDGDEQSGQIRVLGPTGRRVAGWLALGRGVDLAEDAGAGVVRAG